MADFDEELRRQAAISSLLAQQPESQPLDTQTDEQVVPQPEVIKPDTQADYHRLINQAFDTKTDEQVTGSDYPAVNQSQGTVYPTIAQDQGQPDKKFDTAVAESVMPYGERATPEAPKSDYAPKDTGKGAAPEDYPTVAQDQGKGESSGQQVPDALNQVERATLVKLPPQVRRAELIDPDPDRNYFELNQADKPVPGFVPGSKNAILNPAAGVIKPDPTQGNLGDEELARQILAGAPDKLAPRAQPAAPKATIVQDPIVTRSIAKNIADQSAPAPSQTQAPAPSQAQVTQPTSNDDYNKLMDSFFPSAKAAGDSGSVGTLEAGAGNRVDPKALFGYLQNKFANSPLIGYVPPDGARWGIKTGSAAEWAAFGLAVAKQESDFNTTSYNASDPGGSAGIFQFGQGQTQFTKGGNQFNPQESADAFVRSVEHYVNGGSVANLGATFGSIRRPNEAGQYIPFAQSVAAGAPAAGATAASAKDKMPWDDWAKLSPADQAAAEKEGQDFRTQQISSLDKLNRDTPNPKQFWDKLQQPIEGVTDSQRQAYADNFKQEVTKYAQDFYGEKDPEKAFSRAVSDPGLEAYVSNVGRGLAGAVGQADIGIALAGKAIDRNRADGFMNLVHPDSTGEGRAAFLKSLTDIQDTRHRHDVFNEIYGALPQNTKDAIGDPVSILDSIDHLANPAEQADLNKRIATKKAWVDQQLAGDPELKGTSAGWWTTGTGENLFNTVAALVPGGVGAVVRTTTLGAQMYSSNMDRIAQEHPDWSPDKVSEEASKSAFMTLAPQEAVLAASHGLMAPILKWVGAAAEKPIVRFGIGGGVQVAAAGAGGALGQMGENIAENKDLLKDVPQAAGSAVVQSLPFAVHGGLGALGHEPAPTEPVAPTEPARTEPAPTEPAPLRPITTSEMLGPDRPEAPPTRVFTPEQEAYNKWYPNEVAQGQDPLVIRGAERTTWTPQELSEVITKFPSATPAQLREILETQSPTGLHLEGGFERSGGRWEPQPANLEVEQTRQMRVNQPPITPTELLTRRAPVDLNTAIAQQRAIAGLGGTPPPTTSRTKSFPTPDHTAVYNDLVSRGMDEAQARDYVNQAKGDTQAEILADVQTQMRGKGEQPPPQPGKISGEEPGIQREANKSTAHGVIDELTKGVANKYAEERMKAGELEPIDPNTGLTTEALMARALKMRPQEVQDHINNFMENRGGDPRDHAAAVRRQENFLTDRNRALSLKADSNPHDVQAQREAVAARKALNDFYTKGGPISKMKETFHVHGVGLQGEPSIDLSTSGGLHDKFKRETGNSPPPSAEPRLKKAAERVRTTHSDEYKARDKVDKAIDKDGRKKIPSIEEVRDHIAKRMTQMPCRK